MNNLTSLKPHQVARIVTRPAGQETLLYDPASDSVHVLNTTARIVWEMCDGQHTLVDIETHLRGVFAGADRWDVGADVRDVVARFEAEGLIVYPP